MSDYANGDEVYYIGDGLSYRHTDHDRVHHLIGEKCTIIVVYSQDHNNDELSIGVEFTTKAYPHDCDGRGRYGYCMWLNKKYITKDKAKVLEVTLGIGGSNEEN